MKVFQILNGFCHWDATPLYSSAEEASRFYPKTDVFVDAPDYVFEGFGYDETKEGDARFIVPPPPEGWEYDDSTGTFRPIPTQSQRREQAYNGDRVICFDDKQITVTEAAQLWQYYAAEGNEKADELTALIAEAKSKIREQYPNEDTEETSE